MVAGLISWDGKVLVGRRALGERHAGKWEFPGGKVRAGETLEQALVRELNEELAIRAKPGTVIQRRRFRYGDGPCLDLAFIHVRHVTGVPRNQVFSEIRWVATADLPALDFLEADRRLVGELASGEVRLPETVLETGADSGRSGVAGAGGVLPDLR